MPTADGGSVQAFRLLVVPGVTVDRWARTWAERRPETDLRLVPAPVDRAAALLATDGDAALLRLPVDQDSHHAIPLYTEATVVLVPREHLLTAADELTLADLADEQLLHPLDDPLDWSGPATAGLVAPGGARQRPATTAAAVELVAAGVGVLVTAQSLARTHHRRDLTYRVVTDAPTSTVALAWHRDRYTELVEEMIGVVRGRTANSTRGRTPDRPAGVRRAADQPAGGRQTPDRPAVPPRRRRGR